MGKNGCEHVSAEQRRAIETGLDNRDTLSGIARTIGFDVSAVRREMLRNRRHDGPARSANKDKDDRARLGSCAVRGLCRDGCERRPCRRRRPPRRAMGCELYEPRTCPTVEKAPFACNARQRCSACALDRCKCSAESADAQARRRAGESREGADMAAQEMGGPVETVRSGIAKGQSIHRMFEANEMPCSERSFYRHVENGSAPMLAIGLAEKVKCKKRRRAKKQSREGGFCKGREHEGFMEPPAGGRACATEVDAAVGRRGGSGRILGPRRADPHLRACPLLQAKAREETARALDWPEARREGPEAGESRFGDLFGLMLLDRGCELDDLLGRDGSEPQALGAATPADVCPHVSSSMRKGRGNASPFALAQPALPAYLPENPGPRPIPPREVVGAPNIPYRPDGADAQARASRARRGRACAPTESSPGALRQVRHGLRRGRAQACPESARRTASLRFVRRNSPERREPRHPEILKAGSSSVSLRFG